MEFGLPKFFPAGVASSEDDATPFLSLVGTKKEIPT